MKNLLKKMLTVRMEIFSLISPSLVKIRKIKDLVSLIKEKIKRSNRRNKIDGIPRHRAFRLKTLTCQKMLTLTLLVRNGAGKKVSYVKLFISSS